MRIISIAAASILSVSSFGLVVCANAAETASSASVAQPINYEGNDGQLVCHHIVHEGQLTAAQECHTQAGWDRLRHEYTLRTLDIIQRHALLQKN